MHTHYFHPLPLLPLFFYGLHYFWTHRVSSGQSCQYQYYSTAIMPTDSIIDAQAHSTSSVSHMRSSFLFVRTISICSYIRFTLATLEFPSVQWLPRYTVWVRPCIRIASKLFENVLWCVSWLYRICLCASNLYIFVCVHFYFRIYADKYYVYINYNQCVARNDLWPFD